MSYQEKSKTKYLDSKNKFEQKAGLHLDIPLGTKSIDENENAKQVIMDVNKFVPSSVTVPSIDNNALIKKGITHINDYEFMGKRLTSVEIPASVTSIGENAFKNNELTSVEILDSVTSIGIGAFAHNQLSNVIIPDSVTIISDNAFANNKLTSVTIGNKVKSIGRFAFANTDFFANTGFFANNQLTSVKIPDSITSIGEYAFADNKLTNVVISNKVTSIDYSAFGGNKLTSVEIPNSVTSIGDRAFVNNKLTSVEIPNSVTSIGHGTFGRNELTRVKIPDFVTSIGEYAFVDNKLTSIKIPDSVTSIGDDAFRNNQLTEVTMPARFNTYKNRKRIFGENYNIRDIFFNNHLEISKETTIISDNAFADNKLTSVKIPDSVTIISDNAFADNKLTSVKIPDSVTSIGNSAFAINKLTSVTIGNKVTRIDSYSFADNQLTSVVIPNSVTIIGDKAFDYNLLTTVTIPDNFNNDTEKARIFGSDFTKITFTLLSINPINNRLFPTVAPVVDLVEEHTIFDTIENELKNFGLNIRLGTFAELRVQFRKLVNDPLNFATFNEALDASGSKNIEFNRLYSDGTIERKFFTFKEHLKSGSYNSPDIYIDKTNNKEYIFRSSISSTFEDQFKSFYENLKHIILYIIIRKRLGNIKFIPQPYHFGVKKDTTTGQITLYIVMEKGEATLKDYIKNTSLSAEEIKKLVFSIYCDLHELSFLCMKDGDISTLLKFKHNDFKCNNLVVSESGSPLIIDFGFSQFTLTDAGRSIKFISCSDRTKSIYYETGPNGYNVTHDMLQLIASFNLITKPGFKPFEILKFTNNPASNILDTNIIVNIINSLYGPYAVNSPELFRKFYEEFNLGAIYTSRYTKEITPSELANNIGLTLADRIIDKFEKKYRKYKMKYLNLVAKLTKS